MQKSNLLSFLVVNRNTSLGKLIQRGRMGHWKLKATRTETQDSINHAEIAVDVTQFLEEYNMAKRQDCTLEYNGMAKVIKIIYGALQQLIEDDPSCNNHYKNLIQQLANVTDELNNLIFSKNATSKPTNKNQENLYEYYWQELYEFDAAVEQLTETEKRCLSFCLCLFSTFTTTIEIKKRDLIKWWFGMELINDHSEGEDVLKKLVEKEFILHSFVTKATPSSWYRMHTSVLLNSEATESLRTYGYQGKEMNRLFIVYSNDMPQASTGPEQIAAAINNCAYTLNTKTFDWVFQMKNAKVIHLGSWRHDMDYVVVEDIIFKFLKALKNLKEARFLSLQGISRIEELPKSVYSLTKLKVLDLKGCHDLRHFPKGIESLQELVHLDMSECYQLEHIPKAITSLSKLRVLKGFVINSVSDPELRYFRGSSCEFSDLPKLEELRKLTVRTRRMNFPTSHDIETLCKLQRLIKFKIAWVGNKTDARDDQTNINELERFSRSLHKLEIQAAPDMAASKLLSFISNRRDNHLKKLYISGGGLREFDISKHCFLNLEVVRLRNLPHLHINWYDFRSQFQNLSRVEIFECPNLIFFPSNEDGVWEKEENCV